MAVIKQTTSSSASITITLASLVTGSARQSTSVDNTTNNYMDAMVTVTVKLATGTPSSDKTVYLYVFGSEDGTNYTDNAGATDAAITLRNPTNLIPMRPISTPDSGALSYKSHPFSIAAAFGGVMPRRWGVVVENKTGLAFDSTGNSVTYSGIYATST